MRKILFFELVAWRTQLLLSGLEKGRVEQALWRDQKFSFGHVKFGMSSKDSSRDEYMHHGFGKIPGLET